MLFYRWEEFFTSFGADMVAQFVSASGQRKKKLSLQNKASWHKCGTYVVKISCPTCGQNGLPPPPLRPNHFATNVDKASYHTCGQSILHYLCILPQLWKKRLATNVDKVSFPHLWLWQSWMFSEYVWQRLFFSSSAGGTDQQQQGPGVFAAPLKRKTNFLTYSTLVILARRLSKNCASYTGTTECTGENIFRRRGGIKS
jgi:hypothetical protein